MLSLKIILPLMLCTLLGNPGMKIVKDSRGKITATQSSNSQENNLRNDLKFRSVMAGLRMGKDRRLISFTDYKASDGVWLEISAEHFSSATVAEKSFNTRASKGGQEVVERGFLFDEKGRRIGERAVINLSRGAAKTRIIIILKDEPVVYVIESPSLKHALAFEKQRRWVVEDRTAFR